MLWGSSVGTAMPYVEIVFVHTCTVVYVTVPIAVHCHSFTLILSL